MLVLLHALRGLCELLPRSWARRAGHAIGDLADACGVRRRLVVDNMHRALGLAPDAPALRRIVRASYRHLGLSAIEFLRLRRIVRREGDGLFVWRHRERLDGPRTGGQLLLTGHQGNFTLLAAALARRREPVAVVIKRLGNRTIERFWVEQITACGLHVVYNRDSMREILRLLRHGASLGILYDQHDSRGGIWVDFLGRPATAFRSLPILAERSPQPVIPLYITRLRDGRHLIDCCRPIPYRRRPGEDPLAAQVRHAQRYTDSIAAAVRRCPGQWLWLHRRWRRHAGGSLISERARALLAPEEVD